MNARDRLPVMVPVLLLALAPAVALAETDAVPKPLSQEWAGDRPKIEERCEPSDDRYATAPLFRIAPPKPGDRVYLFARKEPCAVGARCPHRQRSYLVAGDIVLGSTEDRGYRCVYFGSRRGELITGFVPAQSLVPVAPETALDRGFLLGAWRRDAASRLVIRADVAAGIAVSGSGYWKGASSVNVGEFGAKAGAVTSPLLVLREEADGCMVVIERRGPFLLANDNERSGGHNVRFVGIYIRQTAR